MSQKQKPLKAVLFDMDGVLADSEELIFQAARKMFGEHGIEVHHEDFRPYLGTGEDSYLGNVARKYGYAMDMARDKARTYEIYAQLAPGNLKLFPGASEFIGSCRKKNLRLAVATSADEYKMKVNLKALDLDDNAFDETVNGLEVTRKKPDPEIYLKAASKLHVNPSECLVVEDAVSGIEAAKSAGMYCLAVTNSYGRKELGQADWVVDNLNEFIDVIRTW